MNWDYCTHVPLLYEATRVTSGSVVELGTGLCSTPLLHALVTYGMSPRKLYTVDDDASWLGVIRSKFKTNDCHEFIHVVDWTKNLDLLAQEKHSVVFIDNGKINDIPAAKILRWEMISLFKNAEVLIVHDANNVLEADEASNLWNFRYRIFDNHVHPATLWLSNSLKPEFVMSKRS